MADARRELHIPFTVIAFAVGFVGEYAGRADFGEVARELTFQRAIFNTAEIDVVIRAENTQVGAAGVIVVIAHAAIASDAAVHLMIDERAQVLVLVRAFLEAITARIVASHHRHILQMAMATFLTNWAVVRVVDHQPFHHRSAELLSFSVFNGDIGVVGGWRHARHHQTAAGVVSIGVLLDRALAASAHRA